MLFIFPDQQQVIFKSPARLQRLKGLYQTFPERLVKGYLKSFAQKSEVISQQWSQFSDALLKHSTDSFIAAEFLPQDDSALQFEETRTGVLYSENIEQIAQDFYESYFSHYEIAPKPIARHDEEYLLKKYKNLLHTKNRDIEKYVKPGITIASSSVSLKSDLVWQNGTTNLVKSLGFDLMDAENINRKSLEYFGRLNFLSELAEKEKYRFDLLVSKPQDHSLYGAYEKALVILESSAAPKVIVEERDFDRYSEKTISEVLKE